MSAFSLMNHKFTAFDLFFVLVSSFRPTDFSYNKNCVVHNRSCRLYLYKTPALQSINFRHKINCYLPCINYTANYEFILLCTGKLSQFAYFPPEFYQNCTIKSNQFHVGVNPIFV